MNSTDIKRRACELFIAAIFQSASDMALDIASEVSANGDAPSLTDENNLLIFSSEWSFAKLAWLSRRTHEIRDPQLRTSLTEVIDQKAKAVADVADDDPMAFMNYYMLADAFDKGVRDSAGLPMGPGPIISDRYKRSVARFKK